MKKLKLMFAVFMLSYSMIAYGQTDPKEGFYPGGYMRVSTDSGMTILNFPQDFRGLGLAVGEEFPAFELFDINGNKVSSKGLKGKVAVLNFTFVGCSGCKWEHDNLQALTAFYKANEDVVFINFINSDEWRIKRYLKKYGDKGYVSISIDKETYKEKFQVVTAPTHIFLKDGIIIENLSVPLCDERANPFVHNIIDSALTKL